MTKIRKNDLLTLGLNLLLLARFWCWFKIDRIMWDKVHGNKKKKNSELGHYLYFAERGSRQISLNFFPQKTV